MKQTKIDPATLKFKDGRQQVKVDDETDCWIWLGYCCRGYGRVRCGKRPSVQAHRAIYERVYGRVDRSLDLGHTCMRRSCVNPDHVRPISKQQNGAERYEMPTLGKETRREIEGDLLADYPNGWISNKYSISIWSVRRIAEELAWRDQFTLDLEVPF